MCGCATRSCVPRNAAAQRNRTRFRGGDSSRSRTSTPRRSPAAVRGRPPASKATPELVIGGERIGGNVCDEPMPFVTMAADGNLVQSFVRALQSGIGSSAARAPGRMLVVNDLTCGALPSAAAAMGFRVDVVNEHGTVSDASKEAASGTCACTRSMAAGKRDALLPRTQAERQAPRLEYCIEHRAGCAAI